MTETRPPLPVWAKVKLRQRLWFLSLLAILLPPLGLALLWLQTAYKKTKAGDVMIVPVWEKLLLTGGVAIVLGLALPNTLRKFERAGDVADGLSVCTSKGVKETLTTAFNNAQFARQLSLSVVEIRQITEEGQRGGGRSCRGQLTLNNTEQVSVRYLLESRDDGSFLLTFELVQNETFGASEVADVPRKDKASAAIIEKARPPSIDWAELTGKHPYDVMTDRHVRETFMGSFEDRYRGFIGGLEVGSPTELIDGKFLVGSGCAPRECGSHESYFAIDVTTGAMSAWSYSESGIEVSGGWGNLQASPALAKHLNEWREKF